MDLPRPTRLTRLTPAPAPLTDHQQDFRTMQMLAYSIALLVIAVIGAVSWWRLHSARAEAGAADAPAGGGLQAAVCRTPPRTVYPSGGGLMNRDWTYTSAAQTDLRLCRTLEVARRPGAGEAPL